MLSDYARAPARSQRAVALRRKDVPGTCLAGELYEASQQPGLPSNLRASGPSGERPKGTLSSLVRSCAETMQGSGTPLQDPGRPEEVVSRRDRQCEFDRNQAPQAPETVSGLSIFHTPAAQKGKKARYPRQPG